MQLMDTEKNSPKTNEVVIDISQYIRILRRHKLFILTITCIFLAIGIVYLKIATPIYSASVKLQADPIQPNASASDQYISNSMIYLFYETQYEIIRSRKVAETVVDKLNLVESIKNEIAQKDQSQSEDNFLTPVRNFLFKNNKNNNIAISETEIRTQLAQEILASLRVEGGTQSQIINIYFESSNSEKAANVVNAVAEAYSQFGLEARLAKLKDTSTWLSEQLDNLKANLQTSEEELRDFRLNQNLMDTDQQERIASTQLQNLNTELVLAQTQLSQAQELYTQVARLNDDRNDFLSIGPIMDNATIRDLVKEENLLKRKLQELTERYGDKHPKMIAARSELQSTGQTLRNEINKVVENIRKNYNLKKVQLENIKSLIQKTTNDLQNYQGDSFQLTRLEREVENNRRIYESFLNKLMETNVSSDYDASNIRIIDKATIPKYPIKPRTTIVIALSIFLGLLTSIVAALTKELLGNVFKTPDQLELELGLPSLGVTPLVKTGKKDVPPEKQYITDQRSTFSEAINTIRTGLLFSDIDNPPKTILVTSTTGSEGKTTLSINLAASLSQMDSTLLIELDMRKPAVARDLNIKGNYGLSDMLSGKVDRQIFHDVTNSPNLKVVTCGTIPPNPMELISSTRFSRFLDEMKTKFRYIVIDSPPTLPVSDSLILAKIVDATIVAVKAEDTKISMAKETISRLHKVNAKITGLVLTQASPQKMSYYGQHYYQDSYYGES